MTRDKMTNFEEIKEKAAQAILPLKPADKHSTAPENMLFSAGRTKAGRLLPEPYLVYFLLVDLLGFKDLGRWEKLAYSIPVDLNGIAYLIEHRKLGLGVFAANPVEQEGDAMEIVQLIQKAVKAARPYFEHLAKEAAKGSKLNVANYSNSLYERFDYLRQLHHAKRDEAEMRKDECITKENKGKMEKYNFDHFTFQRLD